MNGWRCPLPSEWFVVWLSCCNNATDTVLLSCLSAVKYSRDVSQDSVFFPSWLNVTGVNPGLGLLAAGRRWCSPPLFTKKERGIIQEGWRPALCLKSKSYRWLKKERKKEKKKGGNVSGDIQCKCTVIMYHHQGLHIFMLPKTGQQNCIFNTIHYSIGILPAWICVNTACWYLKQRKSGVFRKDKTFYVNKLLIFFFNYITWMDVRIKIKSSLVLRSSTTESCDFCYMCHVAVKLKVKPF